MKYEEFKKIFNDKIFLESKRNLLIKISESPERYIGLFRPTKPKAKIIQNLTQSNEIKFGDAFEILIEEYLKENSFKILEKKFKYKNKNLDIDQHFSKEGKLYFVEQKIRDDHDSSKIEGQIRNFEKKLNVLIGRHGVTNLIGIMYFIDPDFLKNKKYYEEELSIMHAKHKVELHLFYGEEFFDFLNLDLYWNNTLKYLEKWREKIPETPEINFDKEAKKTFNDIKDLKPLVFGKIFSNPEIFEQIILTLFPEKKVLFLLKDFFKEEAESNRHKTLVKNKYRALYEILEEKLHSHKNNEKKSF
jgi:hypothetical protein